MVERGGARVDGRGCGWYSICFWGLLSSFSPRKGTRGSFLARWLPSRRLDRLMTGRFSAQDTAVFGLRLGAKDLIRTAGAHREPPTRAAVVIPDRSALSPDREPLLRCFRDIG